MKQSTFADDIIQILASLMILGLFVIFGLGLYNLATSKNEDLFWWIMILQKKN